MIFNILCCKYLKRVVLGEKALSPTCRVPEKVFYAAGLFLVFLLSLIFSLLIIIPYTLPVYLISSVFFGAILSSAFGLKCICDRFADQCQIIRQEISH